MTLEHDSNVIPMYPNVSFSRTPIENNRKFRVIWIDACVFRYSLYIDDSKNTDKKRQVAAGLTISYLSLWPAQTKHVCSRFAVDSSGPKYRGVYSGTDRCRGQPGIA